MIGKFCLVKIRLFYSELLCIPLKSFNKEDNNKLTTSLLKTLNFLLSFDFDRLLFDFVDAGACPLIPFRVCPFPACPIPACPFFPFDTFVSPFSICFKLKKMDGR